MLYSAISFAKKDLFIDKKMQWKMSQNSEQLAGNGGKDVFCDFDAVLGRETADGARRRCGCAGLRDLERTFEVLILTGRRSKKSLLIEQAFRIWSVIEDDSPLCGSPCGPLLTQRSLASLESNLLPPEVLILTGRRSKKSLLIEQAFRIWSVIEDDSPLCGSPCGPLLTQRSLASLESNLLPPEVLILTGRRCKKACSLSRLFEFGR